MDIEITDLTNDAYDDVMFYNFGFSPDGLFVLRNTGAGSFVLDSFYDFSYPYSDHVIKATDADGDGDNDAFLHSWAADKLIYMINNGNGKFSSMGYFGFDFYTQNFFISPIMSNYTRFYFTIRSEMDYYSYKRKLYLFENYLLSPMTLVDEFVSCESPTKIGGSDFDGDGDIDYCAVNFKSGLISIIQNRGDGKFVKPPQYQSGYGTFSSSQTLAFGLGHLNPFDVECGDLDNDGYLNLVVSLHGSSEISLLINDGTGDFTVDTFYETGQWPCKIALEDMDGDNFIDILVAEEFSNTVGIFKNDGQGVFTLSDSLTGLCNPTGFVVCDFDCDTLKDVAVANAYSNSIKIFKNLGSEGFTECFSVKTGYEPWDIECADADGDGNKDLLTVNFKTNNIAIHYGDGSLTFSEAEFYGVDSAPSCMVLGDFNGNGGADVITGHYTSDKISVLLSEITTGAGESPGYENGDGGIKFELLTPDLSPGNFDFRLVISGNSNVTIEIYNILGQKVKTIVEGNLTSGTHLFRWERDDYKNVTVSDGVYFILMRSENTTNIKKISLI